MDVEFKPKFSVIDVVPIVGRHDASNLSTILKNAMDSFGIDQQKVHVVVRDGGMKATTEAAGFKSLWCWAHVLNRVSNLETNRLFFKFRQLSTVLKQ